MKSISASIIVVAGVALILGGAQIQHGDTKTFVQAVGCVVGALGLWGWFVTIKEK
jgi:drug/metabolite transporter (DMT)-like permease